MKSFRCSLALGAFFCSQRASRRAATASRQLPSPGRRQRRSRKPTFNHWLRGRRQVADAVRRRRPVTSPTRPTSPSASPPEAQGDPKPAKGQRPADRRAAQGAVQAGVQRAARPGHAVPDPAQWIQGEAADQGVKVTDARTSEVLQAAEEAAFPKETDYQAFLKQSGMTQEDILFRVKLDPLSNKIRDKVTKGKDKVTQAQITTYYNKNKTRFAQPERRDLAIVLTKTPGPGQRGQEGAGERPVAGRSWPRSTRSTRRPRTPAASSSASPRASRSRRFDKAVFARQDTRSSGRSRRSSATTSSRSPRSRGLAAVAGAGQRRRSSSSPAQNQQKALNDFVKDFQKKWKDRRRTAARATSIAGLQQRAEAPKKTADDDSGAPRAAGDRRPARPQPGDPAGAAADAAPQTGRHPDDGSTVASTCAVSAAGDRRGARRASTS